MSGHGGSGSLSEEMRRWSNWGHWAEGALLAAVGVLAWLEAARALTGIGTYSWAVLLVAAGVLLPLVIFGHGHEAYEEFGGREAIWADPQQRQHLVMAAVLVVSGVSEVTARNAGVTWLGYVWPLGLAFVGILFTVHTQHGTSSAARRAVLVHRVLGVSIVLAGVARAVQLALEASRGFWAYAWVVILLVVALQLLVYREPVGAYEPEPR
jgi:hypothetical protein